MAESETSPAKLLEELTDVHKRMVKFFASSTYGKSNIAPPMQLEFNATVIAILSQYSERIAHLQGYVRGLDARTEKLA
jgi:hypothetical protein